MKIRGRVRRAVQWTTIAVVAAALGIALVIALRAQADDELPQDLASCIHEADQADAAHDVERVRRVLEHADTLTGDPRDAAKVQRRLSVLDWKYDQRFDEARARLLDAAESGADAAEAWIALARMEQHRGDFAAARASALEGLEAATKTQDEREAGLALARASIAEAAEEIRAGRPGDTEAVRRVRRELYERVKQEPGLLEPSRLLLTAALILDQGDIALLAWRSYFHVGPGGSAPNAVASAGADLERLLPAWRGAAATPEERIELVRALGGSRFFTEAALVALDPRAGDAVREDPRVRELVAWEAAIREVGKIAEEHYRRTILGTGDADEFKNQVKMQAAPVLVAMGFDPSAPMDDEALAKIFDDRFGAYVNLGRTAGYDDLHMGHRIVDETRTVEQYGHRADLRFVALDVMVSNGFQSWAWESGAQHGGWEGRGAIWQVRPAYAGGGLKAWNRLHLEDERAEADEELTRETALDEERARDNPYAYLPGLALRLKRQGTLALLERLSERGLAGEDLRMAFLRQYEDVVLESSIFAHEGRHAIDKLIQTDLKQKWMSEYYAKLSEVAFSPTPRLSLGSIFHANIGDSTPHGQANRNIMEGLVKWMEEHGDEIRGLDGERPLLPQFDLLTDEQMRAAFRSMDPLAKGAPATPEVSLDG